MDPNTTLDAIRDITKKVENHPDDLTTDDLAQLAEYVVALDEWLSAGGFLPEQWERAGRGQ